MKEYITILVTIEVYTTIENRQQHENVKKAVEIIYVHFIVLYLAFIIRNLICVVSNIRGSCSI
jgi:hypothetical protein